MLPSVGGSAHCIVDVADWWHCVSVCTPVHTCGVWFFRVGLGRQVGSVLSVFSIAGCSKAQQTKA